MKEHRFVKIWCLLIGCLIVGQACAAAPDLSPVALWQMHHTVWTARDGLPAGVNTMTQGKNGYLWMGSAAGLFRFDGVNFEPYHPRVGSVPSDGVGSVQAAPDGTIWVGWALGGVSAIKDGVVVNYGKAEGLNIASIWTFSFDSAGRTWAVGNSGVARFDGNKWHQMGPADGFSATHASAMIITRKGETAVFTSVGIFLMGPGERRFQLLRGSLDVRQSPIERDDGRIILMERRGIRLIDTVAHAEKLDHPWIYRSPVNDNGSMLLDDLGKLWFDTREGLHRSTGNGAVLDGRTGIGPGVETYAAGDGLSGKIVYFLLKDREQNIWISTNGGLDRFRRADVAPIRQLKSALRLESVMLTPLAGSAMGIGSADPLNSWSSARTDGVLKALQPDGEVLALLRDRQGVLWRANEKAFFSQTSDGSIVQLGYPPGSRSGSIFSLAQDTAGALWVSIINAGVYRYDRKVWSKEPQLPGGGEKPAFSVMADRKGRVWFGYPDNKIALLENGKVRIFGQEQGVGFGWTAALFDGTTGIWAGGTSGLALYRDGRFIAMQVAPAEAFNGISGIVESADGSLWLNGSAGLVRVPAAELALFAQSPGHIVRPRIYTPADGFEGQTDLLKRNAIAVAGDGKVWASTSAGTFWIDPAHVKPAPPAPQALVQAVAVDGTWHVEPAALALHAGPADLEIKYTATGLATPELTRFRYKLAGYDRHWQEAGSRRVAFYTKVPHGQYTFLLRSATADGPWSDAGDGVAITIPAAWYQQWWFLALCILATLTLVLLAYRWRVRRTLLRLQQLTYERLQERERIARALHDTFLQSVYGLVLRFQSVSRHLPEGGRAREVIESALLDADATLVEGRSQVLDLRNAIESVDDLPQALIAVGTALQEIHGVTFAHAVKGERMVLQRQARDEIYHLGREALLNAYRHAAASCIRLVLDFRSTGLRLSIEDDGIGIPSSASNDAAGKAGHWGFAGMRERARILGCTLEVDSRPGKTTLSIMVPANSMYRHQGMKSRWRKLTGLAKT